MIMVKHWLLKPWTLAFIPLALLLVVALACGSGDDEVAQPTATSESQGQTGPTPTSASQEMPPTPTGIVFYPTPTSVGAAPDGPTPTATPESAMPEGMDPQYGGTIPMHAATGPISARVYPEIAYNSSQWQAPYYNQLVEYDPETADIVDIRCDLCSTWEVSEDGRTYTYHLNDQARWWDGEPVTAEDVQFWFDSVLNPDMFGDLWEGHKIRGNTGQIGPYFESSRVIDDLTIEVTLQFAAAAWHPTLALEYMKIIPKHVVMDEGKHQGMAKPEEMVGSGPFKFVKYTKEVSSESVKNEDYWKEGRPYIEGMDIFLIVDVGTILAAFAAEEVLMTVGNVDNVGSIESKQFLDDYGDRYNVYFVAPAGMYHVMFNASVKPFDEPKLREAVMLAVHRQAIMETFGVGDVQLGTPFPPGVWFGPTNEEAAQMPGFRESEPGVKHPEDLERARELLTEAGFPDGKGLKVEMVTRRAVLYVDIGTVVAQQLRDFLGIEVDQKIMESAAGQEAYLAGDYQFAIQGSALGFVDPDSVFATRYVDGGLLATEWARGQYTSTWDQVQDLFNQQAREGDRQKRVDLITEANQLLLQDNQVPGIYWSSSSFNIHKKIHNINPNPSIYASNMKWEHIWCDPAC
jgi:peptide/nickel transport system substrate-binding protein